MLSNPPQKLIETKDNWECSGDKERGKQEAAEETFTSTAVPSGIVMIPVKVIIRVMMMPVEDYRLHCRWLERLRWCGCKSSSVSRRSVLQLAWRATRRAS